jgi:hypothetical protein
LAKEIALNQLHWILGRNPLGICFEDSIGVINPPTFHSRFISIPGATRGGHPGAIAQGLIRPLTTEEYRQRLGNPTDPSLYQPETPYFDMHPRSLRDTKTSSYYSNEIYITNNAAFVLGFAQLMADLGSF